MPLTYDLDTHLKELEAVLDDYTGWFLEVTRRLFYPMLSHSELVTPRSFGEWLRNVEASGSIQAGILDRLSNLHQELTSRIDLLLREADKTQASPSYDDYTKLTVMFEEFTGHLRRLEKDCLLEDSGVDALTGLRSKDVMEKDIKREMDRLSRQGKAFSLALVRMDRFDDMRRSMTPDEINTTVKTVADFIKKSMRSFDDAYRLEDGVFVLSLKQTGTSGGIKALKRLKGELDRSKATCRINGEVVPLSLSSCIGEPSDGEDIPGFLENLKKDLDIYQGGSGSVVEYFELSPLQRYIRDKG